VEVDTWLRSLGLGGSTVLAARLDTGDLHPGVASGLVGVGDTIGASAARQGAVVGGTLAEPMAPKAAMAR
jgi:hypothetical protein